MKRGEDSFLAYDTAYRTQHSRFKKSYHVHVFPEHYSFKAEIRGGVPPPFEKKNHFAYLGLPF